MKLVDQGDSAYAQAQDVLKEGEFYVGQLTSAGEKPIDDGLSDPTTRWYGDYTSAVDAIEALQKFHASIQLEIAMNAAAQLAAEVDEVRNAFDYPMEMAFKQEDTERLEKLREGIQALATAKSDFEVLVATLKQVYKLIVARRLKSRTL